MADQDTNTMRRKMVQDLLNAAAAWRVLFPELADREVYADELGRLMWRSPSAQLLGMQITHTGRPLLLAMYGAVEQAAGCDLVSAYPGLPSPWPKYPAVLWRDYVEQHAAECEAAAATIEAMLFPE